LSTTETRAESLRSAPPVGAEHASPEPSTRRNTPLTARQLFWRAFKRNRLALIAAAFLVIVLALSIFAPVVAQQSPDELDLYNQLAGPSAEHPLGTDETGRDVWARLVYGGRVSLAVGLLAMAIGIAVGTLVGLLSGYFGSWTDAILMRLTDGMLVVPTFFLALIILAVFGPSARNVVLVIGLTQWMVVARVVRSEVLRAVPLEFVTAARALGAGDRRVIGHHVLPQAMPSIIVAASLGVANAILTESALSYLGLGIQPPTPTWGNMLSGAQNFIWNKPDLALYPGLMILLSVLAFNSLGDALRDALDPFH
jgi:peptide/nickel transport system permease protein